MTQVARYSGLIGSETVTTGTTLAAPFNLQHTVFGDTSGGAFTTVLPAAADVDGNVYIFKKTTSDSNAWTIDGSGSETIDGATTQVILGQYGLLKIQSDGTNWVILEQLDQGSYTGTLTGCTTSPTETVQFSRVKNQVTLSMKAGSLTGTSNATTVSITGMPAAIQPSSGGDQGVVPAQDNGTWGMHGMLVGSTGILQGIFFPTDSSAGWTISGTKGFEKFTVTYTLD